MPLNVHEETLVELVTKGGALPTDMESRSRLAALRRKGVLTCERTAKGDVWAVGEAAPKPKPKRSRSRKA